MITTVNVRRKGVGSRMLHAIGLMVGWLKSKGSANIAAQRPDVLADLTREAEPHRKSGCAHQAVI